MLSKKENYFEIFSYVNIASILIIFLPLALLTGPFIPDLIVSSIALSFLILTIRINLWYYFNNIFSYIFFFSCLYLIIRSIFSEIPIESLRSSLFYFRFGVFSIAVWYIIKNNNNFIKHFGFALLFTFIISLIDGYYQFFIDQYSNIFNFKSPGIRMSLLLNDRMILGGYLARLFPLLIGCLLYIYGYRKSYLLITAILLITIDLLIYISGERSAFGLLFVSTAYIILMISRYKILRLITFIVSISLIVFLTIVSEDIQNRNINKTIQQLELTEESNQQIIFSNHHHSHILGAMNMFKDNPIFGKGPNLFKSLCDDVRYNYNELTCSTHPHQLYVQLLAETGIIFFLVVSGTFMILIFISIKHFYSSLFCKDRKIILSDFTICLMACYLMNLWPLLPSLDFFNNWNNVVTFLPAGFLLYSIYDKNN